VFVIRWFACSCAFAGAGWFGLWLYEAGWDSGFGWIIGTAVVGGLVAAVAARARGRRGETR